MIRERILRVLVASAEPLARDAVVRVVRQRPQMIVVAEVGDGRAALTAIERLHPDVAVLHLPLPRLNPARLRDALARRRLTTRALVMCEPGGSGPLRALGVGATGVLPRSATCDQLADAIDTVGRGRTILDAETQAALATDIRARSLDDGPVLTPRESDVLTRIAEGKTTAQIAAELQLAAATVKTHTLHLYEKLEVRERAAAVAQAMRRGLLD